MTKKILEIKSQISLKHFKKLTLTFSGSGELPGKKTFSQI